MKKGKKEQGSNAQVTSLIITTINSPTRILHQLANGAMAHGWHFIIVGDSKTPDDFHLEGAQFLSLKEQINSSFKITKLLPVGHYARKNIGYLYAMMNGTDIIIETDDDNWPMENFCKPKEKINRFRCAEGNGWVNVYKAFSDEHIWPRGFPLNRILPENLQIKNSMIECNSCIQQYLINGNTDFDAIYRLTKGKKVEFINFEPIVLMSDQRCPFNSQNTTWWPEAWPFLYLPSYCSFRMTDIWRSFVAQSYLLRNGFHISFHSPSVIQERNPHNLLRDFSDEVPGYLYNDEIMESLDKITVNNGASNYLFEAYTTLVNNKWIGQGELNLVNHWLEDLDLVSKKEVMK